MSSFHDQPTGEAHPESGFPERQSAFSVSHPSPAPGAHTTFSLEAGPESLPSSYHRNRLGGIARDPYSLFCYWELALPVDRFPGARLAIAVHRSDGTHEATALLTGSAGTRFMDVSSSGTLYHLSLGFLPPGKISRKEMLFVIAQFSVRTPRDFPVARAGHGWEAGVLNTRGVQSPEVLALLFPNLKFGDAVAGSPSGAHAARTPRPRQRVPLPPARGEFLPPDP